MFLYAKWIQEEEEGVESFLQKLLNNSDHGLKAHRALHSLSMQMEHRRALIDCSMFVIDWKLLFYGFCACASYLVIIIQFEFLTD
jgi:hypothetical protein